MRVSFPRMMRAGGGGYWSRQFENPGKVSKIPRTFPDALKKRIVSGEKRTDGNPTSEGLRESPRFEAIFAEFPQISKQNSRGFYSKITCS